MRRIWFGVAGVVLLVAGRARGEDAALRQTIEAMVGDPSVARAHWGVMVAGMDGTEIVGLDEAQFFQPASNMKLVTTSAALDLLGPERTFQTRLVGRGVISGGEGALALAGDLVLVGGADANFSGQVVPYVEPVERGARVAAPAAAVAGAGAATVVEPDPLRYLEALADGAVVAGLRSVTGDVVGDDTLFPYEPYPPDWSIEDAVWGYGAPVSAMSVGDNELRLTITPAAVAGGAATVELRQAVPYYTVEASVRTAPAKGAKGGVQVERSVGGRVLRVYGEIAADAGPDVEAVAVEDPAEYAAMALKAMLEQRGVRVEGRARAAHRLVTESRGFLGVSREPMPAVATEMALPVAMAGEQVLAERMSPTLGQDVVVTNKESENLHAELMLHDLGLLGGLDGSGASGVRVVRSWLVTRVGVDAGDVAMYDGSGLSGHDLVTPRALVRVLTWASGQPWFGAWRESLPVGGVDGTLESRFAKAPLKGKVLAKTGTLGEARALSGYVTCASGRVVAFSVMVTDHAPGGHADRDVMDRIVGAIAAAE